MQMCGSAQSLLMHPVDLAHGISDTTYAVLRQQTLVLMLLPSTMQQEQQWMLLLLARMAWVWTSTMR